MAPERFLAVEGVGMAFGASTILTGIDLAVKKGEFVCLIGHSGCGKSTLLNLVAGLLKATAGTILLAGKHVDGPGPDRGVVFQNHSLLPCSRASATSIWRWSGFQGARPAEAKDPSRWLWAAAARQARRSPAA
jgi:ABC-type nitrate/sulfonate/bicarbonate transport system ATPase subunit